MTNSGFSSNRYLSLGNTINIQNLIYEEVDITGIGTRADEKVRSVTLQEFYDDVLGYVSGNIELDLKVLNVEGDGEGTSLKILDDKKTFQLTYSSVQVQDEGVAITDDDLIDEYTNQKEYNSHTNERINYFTSWTDRIDERAQYNTTPDPFTEASVFENIEVTAQLIPERGRPMFANAINSLDGNYLETRIRSNSDNLNQLETQIRALYNASNVTSYHYVVGDAAAVPAPGQVMLQDTVPLIEQTEIKVHSLGYPNTVNNYPEDILAGPPTIVNNYLVYNKLDTVLSVDNIQYSIDYDPSQDPVSAIELVSDAVVGDYYKIRVVATQTEEEFPITDRMVDVYAYSATKEITALLENYMLRTGKTPAGTDDTFIGPINFGDDIILTGNNNTSRSLTFTSGEFPGSIKFGDTDYITLTAGDLTFNSGTNHTIKIDTGNKILLGGPAADPDGLDPDSISRRIDVVMGRKGWLAYNGVDILGWSNVNVDVTNHKIVNLLDPVEPQDAATMNYVDTQVGDLSGVVVQGEPGRDKNTDYVLMTKPVEGHPTDRLTVQLNRINTPYHILAGYKKDGEIKLQDKVLEVQDPTGKALMYVKNNGRIAGPTRTFDSPDSLVDVKYVEDYVRDNSNLGATVEIIDKAPDNVPTGYLKYSTITKILYLGL